MSHYSNEDNGEDVQQKAIKTPDKNHALGEQQSKTILPNIHELLIACQHNQAELEQQNQELEKTRQELKDSHDDFARLFNLSPVSYLSLNVQGAILKANLAAVKLIGCSVDEIVTAQFEQFIHPDDTGKVQYFIQQLVENKSVQPLIIKLHQPASLASFSVCQGFKICGCLIQTCAHNAPSTYVECQGAINNDKICLAIQDITERKYAQETVACLNQKLAEMVRKQTIDLVAGNLSLTQKVDELSYSKQQIVEREAKLQSIFNAAMEGIITIDDAGCIVSVNAAVDAIFGYTEQELIGCHIKKILPLPRNAKTKPQAPHYLHSHTEKLMTCFREVEGLRKDGTSLPLDLSIAKFSIDGVSYITSIVRDVSMRKLEERYHKEHLEELAHVTRLGLMGEMASGIAHEVNQPLTAVASYTKASINFIDAKIVDTEKLRETLLKAHQQAIKAGLIIHRMRDFVKTRAMQRANVDINNLINDGVSLCSADLKHNNIICRLELAKNIPVIYIDDVQIEQVLLNLIRNSIDALKNLPEKTLRHLCIQTHLDLAGYIEVRVKDNGPGISQAEQEKILTPFYSTKSSGMGMGLSISRSLIEAHEGALRFNTIPGKGATFYFTLPIQRKFHGF